MMTALYMTNFYMNAFYKAILTYLMMQL